MPADVSLFKGRIPYASELYGVYQPLLGWKSRRAVNWFSPGPVSFGDGVATGIHPNVTIQFYNHPLEFQVIRFLIGDDSPIGRTRVPQSLDSFVARLILPRIVSLGPDDTDAWASVLLPEALQAAMNEVQPQVDSAYRDGYMELARRDPAAAAKFNYRSVVQEMFDRESKVAGILAFLYAHKKFDLIRDAFFIPASEQALKDALAALRLVDPMEDFDPKTELDRVSLSPLGVVHLFRQYFFEFATFLGPPVQHLWLSPGGSVELIEVSTRRTLVERTTEAAFESVQKTETSSSVQDEIADAVRSENQNNTKLGVSVNTTATYGVPVFTAQASTGASYSMENSHRTAREETHKQLRQQSDKVSSEIKRNFKSTFRTVTETQDVSSKRYLLQNNSNDLVNYELRRKMRQVGVQVQDFGTSLCWQTYVDQPGNELGVAKLVHIAEPADLSHAQDPDAPAAPEPMIAGAAVRLRLEWPWEDSQHNDPVLKLRPVGDPIVLAPPKPGYIFERAQVTATGDRQWLWGYAPVPGVTETMGTETNVKSIWIGVVTAPGGLADDGHPHFDVEVTPFYRPSQKLRDDIYRAYSEALKTAKAERERLSKEAMFKAARERVKAASNVEPRKFEELREEERIVVYRNLIRQLLKGVGAETADARAKHLLAELIQSVFDTDKMLYFVAPEWWVPKPIPGRRPAAASPQDVGLYDPSGFDQQNVISWGGLKEIRPDNYYITEDSTPARLGSSLGWVIQLDGDNLRNAFLNAPWVKAVIPVRPGKELAALNWLTRVEVEGADGLTNLYQEGRPGETVEMLDYLRDYDWGVHDDLRSRYATLNAEQFTLHDAIRYLAVRVKEKYLLSLVNPADPADPGHGYLPTDRVFEKGFDPLQGGFKAIGDPFEVFDQWVEVLPTDQIVAVQVKYDPQTGLQV